MGRTGGHNVKKYKPDSKNTSTTSFLSYVECNLKKRYANRKEITREEEDGQMWGYGNKIE
jgi:hypothetical protein